ncbi:MAG: WXG100 family type VII secretion target [Chloroflexi bacterium]|nr:WXG100 family type VII secretion target [Chloroflexota bacterium]
MPASKVRADYDALQEIATTFDQHALNSRQSLQRLQQRMETLQNGDWIGKGATAFYKEMNSDVLPMMRRLAAALEMANRIIRQSSQIMQEAEDEASRLFNIQPSSFVGGTFGNLGNTTNESVGASSSGGVSAGDTGSTSGGASSGSGSGASASTGAGAGSAPSQDSVWARDPRELFTDSYMSGLIDLQFSGGDTPELKEAMEELAKEIANDPNGPGVDRILRRIAELRGRSFDEIKSEYKRFLLARAQADSVARAKGLPPPSLSKLLQGNFSGSTQQLRFGKVVGDAFGIDPIFGALLNPTGGSNVSGNSANEYHGIFHDAAGYFHNFHNAGPGYDYLGVERSDPSNSASGQQSGLRYWNEKLH